MCRVPGFKVLGLRFRVPGFRVLGAHSFDQVNMRVDRRVG